MTRKDYPFNKRDLNFGTKLISSLFAIPISFAASLLFRPSSWLEYDTFSSIKNRRWLMWVNDTECDYYRAFTEHGYVYINSKNRRMIVGDTVYLYVASKRRVKYDTVVVGVDVKRRDHKYWKVSPPKGATCKLELVRQYNGKALSKSKLKQYGFNGEKTIKLPICNNEKLLDYIEEEFDKICK